MRQSLPLKFLPMLLFCLLASPARPDETQTAAANISSASLLQCVTELSSDRFLGRAPGDTGETRTIEYLTKRFKELGLTPASPEGGYLQKVPLLEYTSQKQASLSVGGQALSFTFPDDYIAVSRRAEPVVKLENSSLIFVGYGVVAPEYKWDDYKGVDVKGKTIVMLVNDPPVPDPRDTTRLDDSVFKGKAMTYYGRWTYKYEIAAEKKAAGAIIIHETEAAAYPFSVVVNSWGRKIFDLQATDGHRGRAAVEAWMTKEKAVELFSQCGLDYNRLKNAARRRDFRPVDLPKATVSFTITNQLRKIESHNLIAQIKGSDKKLGSECVVYSAHWDYFGRDPNLAGDQIFNGAVDNASGVAEALEIAAAFTKLKTPPRRSIVFLFPTAEERNLLGAQAYVNRPTYPLKQTVADINLDCFNPWGRTKDMVLITDGPLPPDSLLTATATEMGYVIMPDPTPEKGGFFRADHFPFARKGVKAYNFDAGVEVIGKPAGYGLKKKEEYTTNDYHKVTDEVKPDWDLSGAVEDCKFFFRFGYRLAQ